MARLTVRKNRLSLDLTFLQSNMLRALLIYYMDIIIEKFNYFWLNIHLATAVVFYETTPDVVAVS